MHIFVKNSLVKKVLTFFRGVKLSQTRGKVGHLTNTSGRVLQPDSTIIRSSKCNINPGLYLSFLFLKTKRPFLLLWAVPFWSSKKTEENPNSLKPKDVASKREIQRAITLSDELFALNKFEEAASALLPYQEIVLGLYPHCVEARPAAEKTVIADLSATSTSSTSASQGWGSWGWGVAKSAFTTGSAMAGKAAKYTGVGPTASAVVGYMAKITGSVKDGATTKLQETAPFVMTYASQAAGGVWDYTSVMSKSGIDFLTDQYAWYGPAIQNNINAGMQMGVDYVMEYGKNVDWSEIQSSVANNPVVKHFIESNQIESAYDLAMHPVFQGLVLYIVPAQLAAVIVFTTTPVGKCLYDCGLASYVWNQLKPGGDQTKGSSPLDWNNLAAKLAADDKVQKFLKENKISSAEDLAMNKDFQNMVLSIAPGPIKTVLDVANVAVILYHSGLAGCVWNKVNGKEATIDFTDLAKTLAADPAVKNYIREHKLSSQELMRSQVFENILFAAAPAPVRAAMSLASYQIGQYLYDNGVLDDIVNKLLPQNSAGEETEGNSGDVELLWRLGRALYKHSQESSVKEPERERLVRAGYDALREAMERDNEHWAVHKWLSVLLDAASTYDGIKARVSQLEKVKEHMLRAAELNPKDATTLYMLGSWCYHIADMPWFQRKIAATIFAAPPESTFEEALHYFIKAEEVQPRFYSQNLLMAGKTLLKLQRPKEAHVFLTQARDFPSYSEEDDRVRKEAAEILKNLKINKL